MEVFARNVCACMCVCVSTLFPPSSLASPRRLPRGGHLVGLRVHVRVQPLGVVPHRCCRLDLYRKAREKKKRRARTFAERITTAGERNHHHRRDSDVCAEQVETRKDRLSQRTGKRAYPLALKRGQGVAHHRRPRSPRPTWADPGARRRPEDPEGMRSQVPPDARTSA